MAGKCTIFETFKQIMDSSQEGDARALADELHSGNRDIVQVIQEYFAKSPIVVKSIDEVQEQELQSLGLCREYIAANFIDDWAQEQYMSRSSFQAERYQYMLPKKQGSPPLYNTYVYAALEHGVFRALCPLTGQILETSASFPIFIEEKWAHIVFYHFKGRESFYIGTAGYPSLRSFIYLPRFNLVIVSPLHFALGYARDHVYFAIAELYRKFVLFTELTIDYLSKQSRHLALLYGLQTNLGHFLTNEYSGFHRIVTTGLYRRVKTILIYKNKKIPLEQLFGEFAAADFLSCDSQDQLFETCMYHGLFVIYPCASHLSAEAAFRVQLTAGKYATESQKRIIAGCTADPLIFINLRKHNKSWQEQVDGIIHLAQALKQLYPEVGILLDGLSDCREDAELIKSTLQDEVAVYNGVDISLMDSIYWAGRADAYLCVIGSGLVLLTCIANKPGIVHSEYIHMGQVLPGGYWSGLRNDIFPPVLVPKNEIAVLPEVSQHLPAMYKNYSMDWRSLYYRLIKLLYPPPGRN
ncbi:hypothetical protein [Sporomusa aerivorans]|uniref:hypothetical protein n=1 Tax=Sporomusa aerivorans TaxID=204936 RepID=UPI00352BA04A